MFSGSALPVGPIVRETQCFSRKILQGMRVAYFVAVGRHLEVHQDDIIVVVVHGVRITALLQIELYLVIDISACDMKG